MKYALTFTIDGTFDTTDTKLFTIPGLPNLDVVESYDEREREMVRRALRACFIKKKDIDYIIENKMYFLRNCDDLDTELSE